MQKSLLDTFPEPKLIRHIKEGSLTLSCIYLVGNGTLDFHFLYEDEVDKVRHSFRASWTFSIYRRSPIIKAYNTLDLEDQKGKQRDTKYWLDKLMRISQHPNTNQVISKPPAAGKELKTLSRSAFKDLIRHSSRYTQRY